METQMNRNAKPGTPTTFDGMCNVWRVWQQAARLYRRLPWAAVECYLCLLSYSRLSRVTRPRWPCEVPAPWLYMGDHRGRTPEQAAFVAVFAKEIHVAQEISLGEPSPLGPRQTYVFRDHDGYRLFELDPLRDRREWHTGGVIPEPFRDTGRDFPATEPLGPVPMSMRRGRLSSVV